MQQPFGDERFTFSLLLVLINRLATCGVAWSTILVRGEPRRPGAPWQSYAAVSLSNVGATFCQYEALKHVSFAVATLGKTAKMLPVMVWGYAMLGRRYGVRDVCLAAAVTGGCTAFLLAGPSAAPAHLVVEGAGAVETAKGLLYMLGYLAADGFTSTFQDKLFRGHDMSVFNQVAYTSAFSASFSLAGLVSSAQLRPGAAFLARHPAALGSALLLSTSATASQMFISKTIKSFGALTFATAMTTRQFASILISALLFGHAMTAGQVAAALVVFGALYFKVFSASKKTPAAAPRDPTHARRPSADGHPKRRAGSGAGLQLADAGAPDAQTDAAIPETIDGAALHAAHRHPAAAVANAPLPGSQTPVRGGGASTGPGGGEPTAARAQPLGGTGGALLASIVPQTAEGGHNAEKTPLLDGNRTRNVV